MKVPRKVPKVEYKKILYATDLSETGRFAFPYAASIASRYSSKLTVFHVVETVEFERYVVGYVSEELWEDIKTRSLKEAKDIITSRKRDDAAIREAVDKLCKETAVEDDDRAYVTYDVVVRTGDPVEEITIEADEGDYDLVVIGEHSGSGISDAFKRKVGSTAWRILHRCRRPVLVVRLPPGQE